MINEIQWLVCIAKKAIYYMNLLLSLIKILTNLGERQLADNGHFSIFHYLMD